MKYRFAGPMVLGCVVLMCVAAGLAMAAKDRAAIRHRKQAAKAQLESFYHTSAALVIGNGAYKNGWDTLPGAVRDVDEVAAALTRHGFAVTLKKNLTGNGFNQALERFIARYGQHANNRLLFYYSGHGHTEDLVTGEQAGYLVMVDAKDPARDMYGFKMGSIPMESLLMQAKMIRSKHVLFLFDSCFSGSILNSRGKPTPDYVNNAVKKPVRQFITSGSAEEPVPDASIFKSLFLDIINGERPEPFPDGYLTGEELGLFLKQNLPGYNRNQHPQYGKINDPRLDKGDFIFFLNPSGSSSPSQEAEVQPPMRAASLEVRTQPGNAKVRILNIAPAYHKGMALRAGRYHVEVSASGYETVKRWVELARGQNKVVDIRLLPEVVKSPSTFTDPVTGMEFVLVKGGCYQMGDTFGGGDDDERPVHEVCVDDFYIGKYEVTQGEWKRIMGSNPSRFKKGDRYPVERVSWNDAQEFIRKLNQKSGKNYRLPTEAEWEYAARSGGKKEKYAGGGDVNRVAWYKSNSGRHTHRVGTKAANGLGLYDMSGNVYEWCQDWLDSDYYRSSPRDNPVGPASGSYRAGRGGCWDGNPRLVRSANRYRNWPGSADDGLGFRLALSVHGQ